VWAIAAVRALGRVTVYSRTPAHAEHFARRVQRELGVQCEAVDSAEAAVKDHDIVVLATNSRTSVIDPHWLGPGTHVTTLGPKQTGAAEFNLDLVEAADIIVTDSLVQHRAYDPPSLVSESRHDDRVAALGAVLTSSAPGRQSDPQLSLYLSVGLAGTEVHLLDRLAAKMRPLP
jgi:ornithine cyclodeaminase